MEADFLRWLREQLPPHPLLKLGIGDDAAMLATAGRGDVVVTTDLIADGVDFNLSVDSPRRIGHKALAINLSDLAAMAAQPLAAVIALNLPRHGGARLAVELYEGLLPLAERYHVAIAGGDTNSWDGPLVVSVTALGEVTADGPLRRDGAQPGDRIMVTGHFGGSILGRHLDVEPRVDEALASEPALSLARRHRLQRRTFARSVANLPGEPLRGDCRYRPNSHRACGNRTIGAAKRRRSAAGARTFRWRRLRTDPGRAGRFGGTDVGRQPFEHVDAERHR